MDRDRILSLLRELKKLLEEDDTRAVRTLEVLRQALPVGMAEDELGVLEKQIGRYDFEEALKAFARFAAVFDDPTGGDQNVR